MNDGAKGKKTLNPDLNEQINALKDKMKLLKKKAKADEAKRLHVQRIKLHTLVTAFVSGGWPEDYETLKSEIKFIIEG